MTPVAETTGAWLEQFTNQPAAPAWLQPLRESAFRRFAELGFPTTHDEDWRFTNVAPIARTSFAPGRTGEVATRLAKGPIQLVSDDTSGPANAAPGTRALTAFEKLRQSVINASFP